MQINLTLEMEHVSGGRDDPERVADFVRWNLLQDKQVTAGGAEGGDRDAVYRVANVSEGQHVDDELPDA